MFLGNKLPNKGLVILSLILHLAHPRIILLYRFTTLYNHFFPIIYKGLLIHRYLWSLHLYKYLIAE